MNCATPVRPGECRQHALELNSQAEGEA